MDLSKINLLDDSDEKFNINSLEKDHINANDLLYSIEEDAISHSSEQTQNNSEAPVSLKVHSTIHDDSEEEEEEEVMMNR